MLAQAEQAVQSKVPAAMQDPLQRVIHAGLTILYSPQTKPRLQQQLAQCTDPAKDAGEGSVRMVGELYKQSNKTMPTPLFTPAAMIFAFEFLDLAAKAGKAQITPDLIAKTAHLVAENMMKLLGVTPDKLHQMIAQGQAQTAQPSGIVGSQMRGA
jgi:hypothetical protein